MTKGELLRKAREGLKKSQAQIAVELGVTQPRVTQLEAGDSIPSHLIHPIATAYGVDPLELLPKPPKKKSKGAA